ncbi:hypothetical protein EVAR_29888_1 [Eumeta japonica]|uniref:Uncharacterized protein n=1 Tax=Eumeta variegata TaxID=151549 RepID=A0A4C1V6R0_EUMVA|nr:hypothetical protein EVAR_29888_1 [Eumeta japonica]
MPALRGRRVRLYRSELFQSVPHHSGVIDGYDCMISDQRVATDATQEKPNNSKLCFDVTTSYKLVCRVTLQETALRSAHVMRSQWERVRGTRPFHSGMVSPPKSERDRHKK